jgi:hypothetical protein
MDELIQAVYKNLRAGNSIDAIHKAIIEKGWSEDDAFLGIKAGQNLYESILKQETALLAKAPPFGRTP